MIKNVFTALFIVIYSLSCVKKEFFIPKSLTLNYSLQPLTVTNSDYKFGWSVKNNNGSFQTHYQIQVSSNSDFNEHSVIYDSKKVESKQSQNIKPNFRLPNNAILFWRVKIWDDQKAESLWSNGFKFFTSPVWEAQWISTRTHKVSKKRKAMGTFQQKKFKNPQDSIAVYMKKDFIVHKQIKKAHLYITGLGYYDVKINNKKIGKQVLDPVFSDYQKKVYYKSFEVTDELKRGVNVINIILGNGFYNLYTQNLFMLDQSEWKAPHKLLFQLHILYDDKTVQKVVSDTSWRWGKGPIVFNSIMGGETFDDRRKVVIDKPVVLSEGPGGKLVPQLIPSMEVSKTYVPKSIRKLEENTYLVDFGENITGSIELSVPALKKGQIVKIFYNEALDSLGYLQKDYSKTHTKGRFQEDRFISNGKPSFFKNNFSYFGFRYVQIENFTKTLQKEDLKAKSIHTLLENKSEFTSSNHRINQLQSAVVRTLKNSIHGMPGEEPTREKMGWTFDAGMNTMEPYLYEFNAITAYEKYLEDLVDGQADNGHIPPIVPTNGWGFLEDNGQPILYDDPWWGAGTILYIMDELVSWTGDTSYYKNYYDHLKNTTDFIHSTADDKLIVNWSLGDWLDPENFKNGWGPGLTSVKLTATLGLYYMAKGTSRIALQLGKNEEGERYALLADKVKKAFKENVYNDNELNEEVSQTGHGLPLWLNIFEEKEKDSVFNNLKKAIFKLDKHIYSGFIGIKPIIESLSENGNKQLVFDMIMQEKSPGWLHMVENEFSTMGENLNKEGYGTGHHPFGANIGYWFYKYLLGIEPKENGFKKMRISPFLPLQLKNASGTINTLYGKISVELKRNSDTIEYNISIPFNTLAEFIPMGEVVKGLNETKNFNEESFTLTSGKHFIVSKIK